MDFVQLDVFAEQPFEGNPLAVFPDAPDLSTEQMQTIAREMNLSETTFVTAVEGQSYDVRIFTPKEELPFAGHPTIGTAWTLLRLGRLSGTSLVQRSPAGPTPVEVSGDVLSFVRTGDPGVDIDDLEAVARAAGLSADQIGTTVADIELKPAIVDAGIDHLLVPVRDLDALAAAVADARAIEALEAPGIYCFTPHQGGLRARGMFPGLGTPEDPGTGSAAACVGVYLGGRIGDIEMDIVQGVEMGRPCTIKMRARPGRVEVGAACKLVLKGTLQALP